MALRRSVFKMPLDQLSRDLIKANPFLCCLFDTDMADKVTETFGTFRDRSVSWRTLLVAKRGKFQGTSQKFQGRPLWTARGSGIRGGARGKGRGQTQPRGRGAGPR